jgi:diguanylate cyclase (GGDEF)-like protein
MSDRSRVLVVDDDLSTRTVCKIALEEAGFDVQVAEGVRAALALIDETAFDAILTDKNMPDGSGLDLLQTLRDRGTDTATLLMTAFSDVASAVKAMELEVSDYLEKPFTDLSIVPRRVGRAVESAKLRRENRELVEQLRKRNAELESLAVRDSLTKLYNHAFFQESLRREVERARRGEAEFSLVLIDLDNFKTVNDTFGHPVGDKVLLAFAALLVGRSRAGDLSFRLGNKDIAARYGGDEFALILPDTPGPGAMAKTERLRANVEKLEFETAPAQTISIGLASFPKDAEDPKGLIEAADHALYVAKRRGRNRIVAFQPALKESEDNER